MSISAGGMDGSAGSIVRAGIFSVLKASWMSLYALRTGARGKLAMYTLRYGSWAYKPGHLRYLLNPNSSNTT